MKKYFMNKYALSNQGAKEMLMAVSYLQSLLA